MEILIAIAHIVGAIIVSIIVGVIILFISSWEQQRNKKAALDELSVRLGVPKADLEDEGKLEEYGPQIVRISLERFSDELFRNRLSDFCGSLTVVWGWLGYIIQVLILLAVAWYTFTESFDVAVYAWLINFVVILFFIVGVLFSLLCKLLTGRYPGQAKAARKSLVNFVNLQNYSK